MFGDSTSVVALLALAALWHDTHVRFRWPAWSKLLAPYHRRGVFGMPVGAVWSGTGAVGSMPTASDGRVSGAGALAAAFWTAGTDPVRSWHLMQLLVAR